MQSTIMRLRAKQSALAREKRKQSVTQAIKRSLWKQNALLIGRIALLATLFLILLVEKERMRGREIEDMATSPLLSATGRVASVTYSRDGSLSACVKVPAGEGCAASLRPLITGEAVATSYRLGKSGQVYIQDAIPLPVSKPGLR